MVVGPVANSAVVAMVIAASGMWFMSISMPFNSPRLHSIKSSPQVMRAPIFSSTSANLVSPCTLFLPIPVTRTVPPLIAAAARK
ncbi:hypothetical protein D3C86_2069220 [compost metagenome]